MEIVDFKYNWCDYLTKCKYYPNINVGSYECECCPYCEQIKLNSRTKYKIGDMKQYFDVYTGIVECNKL